MNKQEYLLNKLSQECIEVAKEVSKALEFGLEEAEIPDKPYKSNRQKIELELNDLMGVLDMMFKEKILDHAVVFSPVNRMHKIKKILKYMEYSRKVGALQ